MPGAQRAEKELVTNAGEDQSEAADEAGVGHCRRCRNTTEVQRKCSRKEIDGHPLRCLLLAALGFALKGLHRKPLMLHCFSYPRVNLLTKFGYRSARRNPQH